MSLNERTTVKSSSSNLTQSLASCSSGAFAESMLLSLIAATAIPVWLFKYGAARDAWLTFALGCVTGGILGNLFDRLGLHGEVWPAGDPRAGETVHAVRDWILWQVNDAWRWPNFNIADSLLVIGAALMFLHALWHPHALAHETAREKATPGTRVS